MPTIATSLPLVALVCLLSGQVAGQLSPNADSTYVQLRNVALQPQGIAVDKITLKRDAATFQLNSGTICFVGPVRDKVTGAVFTGEGRLLLNPPLTSERVSLSFLTREKEYSESFDQLVLRFTDRTYEEIKAAGKPGGAACDPSLLRNSEKAARKELRYNMDARILQDVFSSEPGGLFVAFVHGKHYDGKTLFVIDPHGAPMVEPEEIKLETYNENKTGIWAAFSLLLGVRQRNRIQRAKEWRHPYRPSETGHRNREERTPDRKSHYCVGCTRSRCAGGAIRTLSGFARIQRDRTKRRTTEFRPGR